MGEYFAGESSEETRRREEEILKRRQEAEKQRQKAEADRAAAQAEAARKIGEGRFSGPKLSAENLEEGGDQTIIDRGRYHSFVDGRALESWFGKGYADREFMGLSVSARFDDLISEIPDAVDTFKSLPEDVRARYLATGTLDPSYNDPNYSNAEIADRLNALREVGFFSTPDKITIAGQRSYIDGVDNEERSRRIHAKAEFLKIPHEQRKAFLASGDVAELTRDMSAEDAERVRQDVDLLKSSGFFAESTQKMEVNRNWHLPSESERRDMMAAVSRADDAIAHFNSCSADSRRQFLASGDATILAEDIRKRIFKDEKDAGRTDEEAAASAEKIAAATLEEIKYLQQEGFFIKKDKTEGAPDYPAIIDPDFQSEYTAGESVNSTKLTPRSREWFDHRDKGEQIDIVWEQNGGDAALLDSLPDKDKELLARATDEDDRKRILDRAKKEWFDRLPSEKREKAIEAYLDDYKKSEDMWNGIPEEKRKAYLQSGNIEDLAVMVEEGKKFDPNSEEGAQLVFCLEHLHEMGVIYFGNDREEEEWGDWSWRRRHDELVDMDKMDQENKASAERRDLYKSRVDDLMGQINPATGANYTLREALRAVQEEERQEEHRKTIEEMRDAKIKSGELVYADEAHTQLRPEVQRELDKHPELTPEEAALLAQLDGEEYLYQERLFLLAKRQEAEEEHRRVTKERWTSGDHGGIMDTNLAGVVDDFEGQHDKLYGVYTLGPNGERIFSNARDENGNERQGMSRFTSKEEAKKFAEQYGGQIAEFDVSEEAIGVDYGADSREDAIKKLKITHRREMGEDDAAYEERIAGYYEAGLKNYESDKVRVEAKDWIRDDSTGFRDFLLSKGDIRDERGYLRSVLELVETTMDGDGIKALMDEFRPGMNRDRLRRLLGSDAEAVIGYLGGEAPDLGRSVEDIPDEEIQEYLDRIDAGRKVRNEFVEAMIGGGDENQLRKFVLEHRTDLRTADESRRAELIKGMSYDEIVDLMDAFHETADGVHVAVSADVSGDLEKLSKSLSASMYEAEISRREKGWGFIGKIRSSMYKRRHDEESYVDLARRYIETGEKSKEGAFRHYQKEGSSSLQAFRSRYWTSINRTMDFELLARGDSEASLGEGESMSVFVPRMNAETGEWGLFEKTETGERAATGPKAEAILALRKAAEAFAISDGGRAAKAAFVSEINRINESLSEGDKLRDDNYLEFAEGMREEVDRRASFANLDAANREAGLRAIFGEIDQAYVLGVRNSGAEGYRNESGERRTARQTLVENLTSRYERSPISVERIPRIKEAEFAATDLVAQLRDKFDEIGRLPAAQRSGKYASEVVPMLAQINLFEQRGAITGDEREMLGLHNALEAAYSFGGNAEGTRSYVAQLEKTPSAEMLMRMAEGYSDKQLKISINESRMEELSHGNAETVTAAIEAWNALPKEKRFGEIMGVYMSPEGLLLRELGILHIGGELMTEVEVRGKKTPVGKTEKFPTYGLLPNSIETTIDVNDGQLRTIMNESETEETAEDLRHAIEVWNAAPAYARRLVLIETPDTEYTYDVSPELSAAAETLRGVFFERDEGYRATRVDVNTRAIPDSTWSKLAENAGWKEPGTDEALKPESIHSSQMKWNQTKPSIRLRCIAGETTDGEGAPIPDDVLRAYNVLKEAHMVGDFMESGDSSPFLEAYSALQTWDRWIPLIRERTLQYDESGIPDSLSDAEKNTWKGRIVIWHRLKEVGFTPEKAKDMRFMGVAA